MGRNFHSKLGTRILQDEVVLKPRWEVARLALARAFIVKYDVKVASG